LQKVLELIKNKTREKNAKTLNTLYKKTKKKGFIRLKNKKWKSITKKRSIFCIFVV
jgi:hypothetical protein